MLHLCLYAGLQLCNRAICRCERFNNWREYCIQLVYWKTIAAAVCTLPMSVVLVSGCISRYSAGSVYYYQSYHHKHNPVQVEKLQKELKRYLTRKIGFEAVMRIRCTKGLDTVFFRACGGVGGEVSVCCYLEMFCLVFWLSFKLKWLKDKD